ncbi:hypothetical protein BLS_006318 [Venturia inaequalis]|uniref:RING-type domain-containing protein n=2 Tax=Venturia inaequalis TaxID=5025 RepID=A0A8H3UCE1_VENIN|nr:hypothetical protein BLS_006318 [Venturia inaequalis]
MKPKAAAMVLGEHQDPVKEDAGRQEEEIDEDELCPICQNLLYKPVITRCKHTLCESCMAHWADVSITPQMTVVGLQDEAAMFLPNEIETRCPMCRSPTTASIDGSRASKLSCQYPMTYPVREAEERNVGDNEAVVETLTLYIGNTHNRIRNGDTESRNKHEWTFFVRTSRNDLIEEVHIILHPTFRNCGIVQQWPPFEVRRLGWGTFNVYANVILKVGYSWVSSEAEDAGDGGKKGLLPLQWLLDFDGQGSQGRYRLKVKKERAGQEAELAAQREEVRRLWNRQREGDPDYVEQQALRL